MIPNTRLTTAALRAEIRRRMDIPLLMSAVVLLGVGLLALWSASSVQTAHASFWRQVTWILFVGIPVFGLFLFMDPRTWGHYSKLVYALNIGLLLLVEIAGKAALGAQRWIDIGPFQMQPSEPAKLFLIITLADLLARRKDLRTINGLFVSLLHVLPLFILVYLQPDLGTSLVFLFIWLGMSLVAGQKLKYIAGVAFVGALLFAFAWHQGYIHEYQKARLNALITGEQSYHSEIAASAIGRGQAYGTGYLRGVLKEARVVPEQTTDFIFTVIAEEGGFVGSILTVLAFGFFLSCVWNVVANASVRLFRYMAAGIFVVFSFHILINLLMVVGLLPIVGIPLPFMSYGGSAMVLNFAMLGLLLNLRSREKHLVF